MRGFVALVIAVLVAIGIGVGALCATGSTGTTSSTATTGANGTTTPAREAFATKILSEAPLPAGSRPVSSVPKVLDEPMETPGIPGLVDQHRFYLTSESPYLVQRAVLSHLPHGAKSTISGTFSGPSGSGSGFVVSLATSGPNQYLADLVYSLDAVGSGSALRIDAQTVWMADRATLETIPTDSTATLTGYAVTSLMNPSSGAVRVPLDPSEGARLIEALNRLPLSPQPRCMESALKYQVTLSSRGGVRWEVSGVGCFDVVVVTRNGVQLSPLSDARCAVLSIVGSDLPAGASGTERAASECHG